MFPPKALLSHPFPKISSRIHSNFPHAKVDLEAKSGVESVGGGRILSSKRRNLRLCTLTKSNGGVVGIADIGELIADTVGDDVGVQGILLAFGNKRISGKEGTLIWFASSTAELEIDGGCAVAEVGTGLSSTDGDSRGSGRDGSESEKEECFELHFAGCERLFRCGGRYVCWYRS